jgi:hypothetical protein
MHERLQYGMRTEALERALADHAMHSIASVGNACCPSKILRGRLRHCRAD